MLFLLLRSSRSANFAFTAVNDFDSELDVHSTFSVRFAKAALSRSALISSLRDDISD